MVENTVICYCPSFLRTPQQTKPKINIALCIYCHSFKQLVDTCPGLPTSSTDVWIRVVRGSICHYLANMINCIIIYIYIYIIYIYIYNIPSGTRRSRMVYPWFIIIKV